MTAHQLLEHLSASSANREDILRRVHELRRLEDPGFAMLATHAVPELHHQGDELWKKDDLATDFLVVVRGNLMPRLASVVPVQEHQTVGLLPLWAMPEEAPEGMNIPRRTGDIVVTSDEAVLLRIHYRALEPWMKMVSLDVARLFARHLVLTDEALAYI